MQLPFRRKPADDASESATDESSVTTVAGTRTRSYTPSKRELGKLTPKRKAGGRVAEPAPANRREAMKRSRLKQREQRVEARAGMMAGKEEYLLPRDKGPERAMIRDVVDARRNLASYFIFVMVFVLIGSTLQIASLAVYATLFFYLYGIAVIVDSALLGRKVNGLLKERFPKSTTAKRSQYIYAIMRSLNFRRLRMPAARVKIGDKI